MVVQKLVISNVLQLSEFPKITHRPQMTIQLVDSEHHCAHIVRHVSSSADSVVELAVVHHQLLVDIGRIHHRMSLANSLQK